MTTKIVSIKPIVIRLPFRFSFGHSSASRAYSDNVIVKVTLSDGTYGFGEGIPRNYVTGEETDTALSTITQQFAPRLMGLEVGQADRVTAQLWQVISDLGLSKRKWGAAFCAVELAVLDAAARANNISVAEWLGPVKQPKLQYGAVVPFGGKKALFALLCFYKLWGFKTVKLKVGGELSEDISKVALARKIMGDDAILRVDANCAWTTDQAIEAAHRFEPFNIASIEQPVKADDIAGLAKITSSVSQQIVVDESLCTISDAETLINARACHAFNIRISKVGGLLLARKISQMARDAGLSVHMGAQVGESAILTAAGRIFGTTEPACDNYEGANNSWLLQHDISRENLTVTLRGWGRMRLEPGLGINILNDRLKTLSIIEMPEVQPSDKALPTGLPFRASAEMGE